MKMHSGWNREEMSVAEDDQDREFKRKAVRKERLGTVLEILKWGLVVWLLWPLVGLVRGSIPLGRVVLGIALFVVFCGKLFYDTLILEFIRQRRATMKQDLLGILGMLLVVLLLVGFVVFLFSLLIMRWQQSVSEALGH